MIELSQERNLPESDCFLFGNTKTNNKMNKLDMIFFVTDAWKGIESFVSQVPGCNI